MLQEHERRPLARTAPHTLALHPQSNLTSPPVQPLTEPLQTAAHVARGVVEAVALARPWSPTASLLLDRLTLATEDLDDAQRRS